MKFKPEGNLGKLDLLQRHLYLMQMKSEDGAIALSKEEADEVSKQLSLFMHVLSNLNMYENSLENDQYGALVSIIRDLKPYYTNYKGE